MKEVRAGSLKKGDLVYYKDSYFEVVDNAHYKGSANSLSYVHIKCFMSPSTYINISSYTYIYITEVVWLLVRGIELLDEENKSREA